MGVRTASRESLQLVQVQSLDHVYHREALRRHIDHGEVREDAVHAADTRQGIRAFRDDLAFAALGEVLHHHVDLLRPDGEVHRAAHGRYRIGRARVPVREVAGRRDLEGAEHAEVEMATAHHGEGIRVVEEGRAVEHRDRLLSCIDEVRILAALLGRGTHAEEPILRVQDDFAILRQVIRDERGKADAEIHVGAFAKIPRHPGRHFVARIALHALTTRWTKMPGVTTDSGSSSPSSTMCCTSATVQRAAEAMIGPKLRAVLR